MGVSCRQIGHKGGKFELIYFNYEKKDRGFRFGFDQGGLNDLKIFGRAVVFVQ